MGSNWEAVVQQIPQQFQEELYSYASQNLIKLDVFISTPFATEYKRQVETPIINFVANIGGKLLQHLFQLFFKCFVIGLMGLCMGFSFVSCAEIIYYMYKFFSVNIKNILY